MSLKEMILFFIRSSVAGLSFWLIGDGVEITPTEIGFSAGSVDYNEIVRTYIYINIYYKGIMNLRNLLFLTHCQIIISFNHSVII